MDELDLKIILALQEDGRRRYREIASKLGVSKSTVRLRTEQLLAEGVINITAVPNPWKVGFDTMAFIGIAGQLKHVDSIANRLSLVPDVHFVATTTGRFDIIVWVQFRSLRQLSEFAKDVLARIPGITRTEMSVIYSFRKQTFTWALPTPASQVASKAASSDQP